jgi:hypothetical protein
MPQKRKTIEAAQAIIRQIQTPDFRADERLERFENLIGFRASKIRDRLEETNHHHTPEQTADFANAYRQAKRLKKDFSMFVTTIASQLPNQGAACRPDLVKSQARATQKFVASGVVPCDFLAAKIVVGSFREAYEVAAKLPALAQVVHFQDRFLMPQRSGYGDLQFLVNFKDHIAEIKVVHFRFDEVDVYEHKLYEISRAFVGQQVLSKPLAVLVAGVVSLSKQVYSALWDDVLTMEGGM